MLCKFLEGNCICNKVYYLYLMALDEFTYQVNFSDCYNQPPAFSCFFFFFFVGETDDGISYFSYGTSYKCWIF